MAYSDLHGRSKKRVSVIEYVCPREGKWEISLAPSKQCMKKTAPLLIWGTWGMERWSDLSETQQNRYRSLSRLLHFRIYDKWHMAVYLLLICLMLNLWSWRFWNCLKHKTQTDFVILMIYGAILWYILYIMMWFGNLIWISSGSLLLVIIFFFFLSMDLC